MSFVIVRGERFALDLGQTTLGGQGPGALECDALAGLPPFAAIEYPIEGPSTVRSLDTLAVTLNGAPVRGEPCLLNHGDHIEAGSVTIAFGDIHRAGRTHNAGSPADEPVLPALGQSIPTDSSGGCIIRPGAGTRHPVPDTGLTIGRDPDCAIVLSSRDASRVHASIAPAILGYSITDRSSNGIWINGLRVDGVQVLGQGDVIRIAGEEFRFEANAASFSPGFGVPGDAPDVQPARRVPAASAPPMLLAALEVMTDGEWKGRRFRIERPAVQLGRGPHNDIVIAYESVSSSHASLVLRDRTWHVLDLNSRNGTYVEGEVVKEQRVLPAVCELRLGTLTLLFRAISTVASGQANSTVRVIGI